METKLDIKFRLKQRRVIDPGTGRSVQSTKNVLITMRVVYGTISMEFTTGYHANVDCWDAKNGFAIGASDGKSADEINSGLARLAKSIRDTAQLFEEKEKRPTLEEFKIAYMIIKDGLNPATSDGKKNKSKAKKVSSDNQDMMSPKQDTKNPKQRFNNLSDTKKNKKISNAPTFWDVYHEYESYAGKLNDWAVKTRKKYETIRYNLKSFRDWKREQGLPNFDVTFEYFDEDGFQSFVDYLRDEKKYVNTTIRKDIVMLKVVIRWAYRRRYHNNHMFEAFRPALKSAQKKVVFFNKKELEKLENYKIPETKLYLVRVRDVFLFQCFTGIRYSDLANLRRCDVHDDYIEITTIKTVDSLRIELNTHSKAILKKYEPFDFKDGMALPVVSNQKMNQYLHELCKMAGFNEPIRITYYRGNERFDEIKPKHEVIGTHTGRRSFICNALGMGITPQVVMKWTGHSDYKAMKPYIDVADDIKAEAMKKFNDF
jgi:integrase